MGASNRLRLLAADFTPDEARVLRQSASALADVAQQLDRLLAGIRR